VARAFVAVVPPAPVLDAVVGTARSLEAACDLRARWSPREQWHLTLRFLGDHVDLDEAAASLAGVRFEAIEAQLGGLGAFARPARANVLWLGVGTGTAPLVALAAKVTDATATIAPVDGKPYRPHLTLARFDRPADVRGLLRDRAGRDDAVGPPWSVTELVLVESRLGRGPAQHRVHARLPASA
jgi:2'-5' RNA ligase